MNAAATRATSLLSPAEIENATAYLISTRENLLNAVASLNEAQWNYQTDPARWSIAELLEHIVIVETRVHAVVGRMQEAPAAAPDRVDAEIDELVTTAVPQRTTRLEAPASICPTKQWSPEESLRRFREARDRTMQLLVEAPALRGHVIPHPFLGPWDGYQWILAAGAHGARHTAQIEEVKASAGFPA